MIAWVDQIKKIRIAVIPNQIRIVVEKMTKHRRLGIPKTLKGTHLRRFRRFKRRSRK